MDPKDFTHLHVHTEMSLLDGAIRIKPLVERLKNLDMRACAITDHGSLAGTIEFYKECKKNKIKPTLGIEAYCTDNSDDLPQDQKIRDNRHLILLAMNTQGWRNLIWLNNQANIHNFYYKPRIYWENLRTRNEGLICLSACLAGFIAKRQDLDKHIPGMEYHQENKTLTDISGEGRRRALILKEIFGNRFYLEIQPHDMWEQKAYNQWVITLSRELDIPLVITTDAHYLRDTDAPTHTFLMAQQFKMTLTDYTTSHVLDYKGNFYIREQDEMYKEAAKLHAEQAFWNTIEIAKQCELELSIGKYEYPDYDIKQEPDYLEFKKVSKYVRTE